MTSNDGTMLVVYTGGTFGMQDRGRGLEATAELEKAVAELLMAAEPTGQPWRYLSLERIIDSADADLAHALEIASLVRRNLTGTKGVVVVHGTDTLAYTGAVAAFALADLDVPVVFTGAQRPMSEPGSDAPANFFAAYRDARLGEPGVRIAFGGSVIPAVRAVKHSSSDDKAFVAFRPSAPGAVGMRSHESRLADLADFENRTPEASVPAVGLLRVFPGLHPGLVGAAARLYPDGFVLECYGAGTAPMSTPGMREAVAEATGAGTPIVIVTQCRTGSVRPERYALGADLLRAGAWDGGDLTADAALAKLGVIAALGLDREDRRIAFSTNLVGEQRSAPLAAVTPY